MRQGVFQTVLHISINTSLYRNTTLSVVNLIKWMFYVEVLEKHGYDV